MYAVGEANSAAQVSMRLNTGRTPSARRRSATSSAASPVSRPSRASEKPMALSRRSAGAVAGRPLSRISASMSTMPRICARNHGSIRQAVWISSSLMPSRIACATLQDAVGRWRAERGADGVLVVALAETGDGDLVEAGQAGLERAQRLLQAFRKGAADRHRLADRFHRGGQHRLGAGKFLERKARNFGDDVIDGRLERGRRRAAGDVVGDLVERVADGELGGDLGNRESRSPSTPAPKSATPADSSRSRRAGRPPD